ncbi:MAG: hypothetical protein B7Y39_18285 [Bdellovibrio sp. 28-41-41]|nr:MAG: hypothetical protein B7Y39_18285 [Bdellovibrio sp. 28-41-41]
MVIFKIILSALLSSQFLLARSGVEEQRKYIVDPAKLDGDKLSLINPFVFYPHSQYITFDIYFDTPNWDIRNSSHSFRLRRVEKKKGKWEYAIQIKSEMVEASQIRTELEYKDFSKQKVDKSPVIELINQFIADESARPAISKKLTQWMLRKKDSSLPPFQKLRDLSIDSSQMRPIVWGHSVRQRYHIYTDKNSALAKTYFIKNSEKNIFLVPPFFKTNPQNIWLMEASFDRAVFRDALTDQKDEWVIHELEIENKYRPRKLGTILLNDLEKKMGEVWNAKVSTRSKYLSSSSHFHKDEKE